MDMLKLYQDFFKTILVLQYLGIVMDISKLNQDYSKTNLVLTKLI